MKRVTFQYESGIVHIWKVRAASWGPDSRNVVLRDAISPDGVKTQCVLIPLAGVAAMFEEDW